MKTKLKSSLATGLILLAVSAIPQSQAADVTSTWTTETINAASTRNWSTTTNWGGTAPSTGDTVNLDFSNLTMDTGASGNVSLQNNIGNFNIYQMSLAKNISSGTGTLTYNSSPATNTLNWVKASGGADPSIILNSGSTKEIYLNFNSNIASGAMLQISGAANGLVRSTGVISGAGGVNINKTNTTNNLLFYGANTYTGNFTLTSGLIGLSVDSVGTANNVTSGALGRGTVNLNGGTIIAAGGAVRTVLNSVNVGGDFTVAISGSKNVTLAGTTLLTGTGVTRTITGGFSGFDATQGTLAFTGAIGEAGAGNGITFSNSATTHIVLSGINTYTGSTTVNGGNFTLSDNAGLKFVIGANGINNRLTGTGTVTLDGDFTFDLSGAGTALGDSWNIVNVGTLTETFGSTFSVVNFYSVSNSLWAQSIGGGKFYNFDETTGLLSVTTIPEPATWGLLALGLTCITVLRRRRVN